MTTTSSAAFVPLTREDFEAAYARVAPHIRHTPLISSRILNEKTGGDVRLKAEIFQRTGSYKIRGPLNKFSYLTDEERKRGVVCSSAGNHAQGVALAARIYGIKAVVCMAANATPSKIEATKAYGAEVVLHGNSYSDAYAKAAQLQRKTRATFVHPYDDPDVIAGQGTIGMEILRQCQGPLDAIFVAIGGGGLISGVASYVKRVRPEVKVIGVQPVDSDAMARRLF